ncbi:hypothetical protein ACFE04_015817 [Oxalis oulophora]
MTKTKDEAAMNLQIAIRCAKAAMLLSALKSSTNHRREATAINEEQERDNQLLRISNQALSIALTTELRRKSEFPKPTTTFSQMALDPTTYFILIIIVLLLFTLLYS